MKNDGDIVCTFEWVFLLGCGFKMMTLTHINGLLWTIDVTIQTQMSAYKSQVSVTIGITESF